MTKYEKNDQVEVFAEEKGPEYFFRKWTVRILRLLSESSPRRYNDIRRSLEGVSPFSLSEELKRLEKEGILQRTVTSSSPPGVFYTLTSKGWELIAIIREMQDWIDRWS
ncbi:MAG: helix-turn-helix transcriptional regulator [Candidatus Thermoplasmatota archaeon]|nr:helix-turn-helix transcriptional regulator [Candidatus Thermoplasmatota archaeon]